MYLRQSFHNLAWVQILESQAVFQMRSRDVMLQYAVIADLILYAFQPVQIPDFTIGKSPPQHNSPLYVLRLEW